MSKRKGQNTNAGTTLVEVLVAFAVLTVIFAVLYQVICLSGDLHVKTVDLIRSDQSMEEQIYRINSGEDMEKTSVTFTLIPKTVSPEGEVLQGEEGIDLHPVWVERYENPVRKKNVYRFTYGE